MQFEHKHNKILEVRLVRYHPPPFALLVFLLCACIDIMLYHGGLARRVTPRAPCTEAEYQTFLCNIPDMVCPRVYMVSGLLVLLLLLALFLCSLVNPARKGKRNGSDEIWHVLNN